MTDDENDPLDIGLPVEHEEWGVRFVVVALGIFVLGLCGLVAVLLAITKAIAAW